MAEKILKGINFPGLEDTYVVDNYVKTINGNAPDAEGNVEIEIGSGGSIAAVQSDWNQNDETNAAFIKNRPFYDSEIEVFNQELTFINGENTWHLNVVLEDLSDNTLVEGKNYTVIWDNTSYNCECYMLEDVPCLGNAGNAGHENLENGLPFFIARYNTEVMKVWAITLPEKDPSLNPDSTIIHCKIKSDDVHKIDPKYLYQPDWNQTDETDPTYIKNRPFYEEEIIKNIYTDAVLPFTYDNEEQVYICQFTPNDELVAIWGTNFTNMTVVWDGTTYVCKPQVFYGLKCIGNLDMLTGGDNGMPFLAGLQNGVGFIYSFADATPEDTTITNTATHTVSLTAPYNYIKTIDTKFIGETHWSKVSNKPFGNITAGTIAIDTTVEINNDLGPLAAYGFPINDNVFVVGATYALTVNGTEYSCTCEESSGIGKVITWSDGTNKSSIQINRKDLGGITLYLPANGTVALGDLITIKAVAASNAIAKIDAQYTHQSDWNQTDTTAGDYIKNKPTISAQIQTDWNQNDSTATDFIKNRPFYEEEISSELVINQKFTGFDQNGGSIRYTLTSSCELVLGETYRVTWDGVEYICVAQDIDGVPGVTDAIFTDDYNITSGTFVVAYISPELSETEYGKIWCIAFKEGSSGPAMDNTTASHTAIIYHLNMQIKTIDPKFIPEIDSLPKVTTDDAGKFLRVNIDGIWAAESIPNAEEATF